MRQLFACDLPSGDLVERQGQVESFHALGFQRQFAHIFRAMCGNKIGCLFREVHTVYDMVCELF